MSIKDEYSVRPIDSDQYKEWILKKHYAKRMPGVICNAYGLFSEENTLLGCITFGLSANKNIALSIQEKFTLYELNRLVVNSIIPKNTLSYFVSTALKQLPSPLAIVSYADVGAGHHGYIYQATNWIYTGETIPSTIYINKNTGKEYHNRTYSDLPKSIQAQLTRTEGSSKHRYFYFVGNKREVKEMKRLLPYPILPYPKGDNQRYDASYEPVIQEVLF